MAGMRKSPKNGFSLKWGLVAIMAICWVVPITVILLYSSYTLANNVQDRIRDTIATSVNIAFQRTQDNINGAMAASRESSYNDTISDAYRKYLGDKDHVALYSSINSYLLQQYGYDDNFNATLLFFVSDPDTIYYVSNRTDSREIDSLYQYQYTFHDHVLEAYPDMGTQIRFMQAGDRLYMVRNIMDSRFKPYAVIVMECDQNVLYESIRSIVWMEHAAVDIDDNTYVVTGEDGEWTDGEDGTWYDAKTSLYTIRTSAKLSGHTIRLSVVSDSARLTDELPDVANLLPLMAVFGALLFMLVLWAYYHYVARPVDALVDAAGHMESGERGYTVKVLPGSREFRYLTERFNSMSAQLKYQFERNNEEQLALQDARVSALRSQINPHFLNNTLEAISWAARMAEDTKVCRMIEALSTMLDAAMARGGRARDTVEQELVYADAYLYILSERLGDRLSVRKEIASETLKALVPCLILQPIVENAFEHGIALQQKGEIAIRSMLRDDMLIIEVENDGDMTEADRKKIARLLDWDSEAEPEGENHEFIGIRNVNRRLKILYGEEGELTIAQAGKRRVLARIVIPHVEYDR
jgi:two-component system sensor histidine kinase YesM